MNLRITLLAFMTCVTSRRLSKKDLLFYSSPKFSAFLDEVFFKSRKIFTWKIFTWIFYLKIWIIVYRQFGICFKNIIKIKLERLWYLRVSRAKKCNNKAAFLCSVKNSNLQNLNKTKSFSLHFFYHSFIITYNERKL